MFPHHVMKLVFSEQQILLCNIEHISDSYFGSMRVLYWVCNPKYLMITIVIIKEREIWKDHPRLLNRVGISGFTYFQVAWKREISMKGSRLHQHLHYKEQLYHETSVFRLVVFIRVSLCLEHTTKNIEN